jgi:hypothetical protein
MSIKVQNAPDSAVVGWHTTADGGQGYWNGFAWTVRLSADGLRPASEHDTATGRVKAAVRAHIGVGATVLPALPQAQASPGRPWTRVAQMLPRRASRSVS